MALFTRREALPGDRVAALRSFHDCAEVIEGARRFLLGTLPTGRVEPAPIVVGLDAISAAIADARGWMPDWRVPELAGIWEDCRAALDEAEAHIAPARTVAASTRELHELLGAVEDVILPLDVFADAETAWRDTWRLPRG